MGQNFEAINGQQDLIDVVKLKIASVIGPIYYVLMFVFGLMLIYLLYYVLLDCNKLWHLLGTSNPRNRKKLI